MIHKYRLAQEPLQTIALPEDAQILGVFPALLDLILWADVDTDKPNRDRRIFICLTGQFIDDEYYSIHDATTLRVVSLESADIFINSIRDSIGYVWHVFEVLDRP